MFGGATIRYTGPQNTEALYNSLFGRIMLRQTAITSKQHATIVEVLSEGEIEGWATASKEGRTKGTTAYDNAAKKDTFFNRTPILQSVANSASPASNHYNFQNVEFTPRFGTANQTHINSVPKVETEYGVGVDVTTSAPVTRSITNSDVDGVRVTILVPQLANFDNDDGNINGEEFTLKIEIIENNGTVHSAITDRVIGKVTSPYNRDYQIDFKGTLNFPVSVRVTRTSSDSDNAKVINAFKWSSYTEIIDEKRTYPNTAYAAFRYDSEEFPQAPARSYRIRGVKVKIPSNATVDLQTGRLTFSGSWNGIFKTNKEWTTCPAWILYDILSSTRFGLGDHISESQLSKYDFYSCSVYNNEEVDDGSGNGTKEARYSCNVLIQGKVDPYRIVNDICSSMRANAYWNQGSLSLVQDKPTDSSFLFTLANVADGGFSYTGSSIKARHSVVDSSFLNLETQEKDYIQISDANAVSKYGVITKKLVNFGCTSRGAAARAARWLLYTEQNETNVCTFNTTIDSGVICRPGAVISIADPVVSGARRGGRVSTATTTQITVDDSSSQTDLDATNNPKLSVILTNGTVETRDVSSISGSVITVSSAFSSAPASNSLWILENDTIETTKWRVLSVTEADDSTYAITALSYNSGKYAYVEDGSTLPTVNISNLNVILNPPSNLQANEVIFEQSGQALVKIVVSWSPVQGATEYQLQYKKDNGNYETISTRVPEIELVGTSAGAFEFRLFTINAALVPSSTPSTLTLNAVGKTAVPANVSNLSYEPISKNSARLRWDQSTELDVKLAGKVEIRHSSKTDGTGTWSNSTSLIPAKSGASSEAVVPLVEGEILIKFIDDGGRASASATSVLVDLPDPLSALAVLTQREDQLSPTPFSGAKTNVFHDTANSCITLSGEQFDSVADVDSIVNFDLIGDIQGTGTYNFANQLDLGAVYSLDLKRHFLTEGYLPNDQFDSITDVDARADWDGAVNSVDAKLYVRTTQTDPASSPTWSPWQIFANGTFKMRGAEFKTVLTSGDTDENIRVKELGFSATMQRRQEQSVGAVSSGTSSSGKTITFSKSFFTGVSGLGGTNAYLPSIGIVAQNLQSGDFVNVTPVTASNFIVKFMNGSSVVDRSFTWSAVGYGLSP